jgi:hypothetical protein
MPKAGHKFRYSFPIIGSLVKRTYSIASSAQMQHNVFQEENCHENLSGLETSEKDLFQLMM